MIRALFPRLPGLIPPRRCPPDGYILPGSYKSPTSVLQVSYSRVGEAGVTVWIFLKKIVNLHERRV